MLIGIIGAPNKGKSTLFSALTLKEAEIADYPFTTINPNFGIAYATCRCAEKELGVKCNPRNSLCTDGTRKIPVNVVDVAGLVEGAHEGKGMGNQFLSDLAAADALILVADASGKTDPNGNSCDSCDPCNDVEIVNTELVEWVASIIQKHASALSKRADGAEALAGILTGLKATTEQIKVAISKCSLSQVKINWSEADTRRFAKEILALSKPILIIANKSDAKGSEERAAMLASRFGSGNVIACSAAIELALRKAERQGVIARSGEGFGIVEGKATKEQLNALKYMLDFTRTKGTNVQEALNRVVFKLLDNIVVYPVEDENRYTDHFNNVLPDAILMRKGSTALDLANAIHTEIGKNMLYAVDARTKRRLGKDYVLNENDVIRIVSAAK